MTRSQSEEQQGAKKTARTDDSRPQVGSGLAMRLKMSLTAAQQYYQCLIEHVRLETFCKLQLLTLHTLTTQRCACVSAAFGL